MYKYYGNMKPTTNHYGQPKSISGMDFSKSIADRNSRLFKTILYLRDIACPCSKLNIILGAWKIHPKQLRPDTLRGYGSEFFSLAIKHDFIRKHRKGRKIYYVLGKNPEVDFIC